MNLIGAITPGARTTGPILCWILAWIYFLSIPGSNVEIKTVGYGHGVGMSQYGAEGLSKEGYNYKQILSHYYTDTELKKLEN